MGKHFHFHPMTIDTSLNFNEDLYHWLVEQHFGILTITSDDLKSSNPRSEHEFSDIIFCTTFKRSPSFGLYKFQNEEGFVIYAVAHVQGNSQSTYRKAFEILLSKYTESVEKLNQPRQGNTGYLARPLVVSV